MLHANAIAAGAITDNMDADTAALQAAKLSPAPSKAPDDPTSLIRDGLINLLESGDEDALTRSGLPSASKLSAIVGFNVDREKMLAVWRALEAETTAVSD